ncbi:trimethylamine methyltransferase family protein [Actinomycetota bacterium]
MKAKLEVLNKNELDTIYQTALDILSKVGINIEDEEIIKLLKDNGCKVDGNIVYMNEKLVKKCLDSTPRGKVVLSGRDPSKDMIIDGNQKYPYVLSHVLMNYYDELKDDYHTITLDDIKKFVTISDNLDTLSGVWMCTLMPDFGKMYSFYEYELAINYTTKPVCISSFEPQAIPPTYEIAQLIAGGKDELIKRPLSLAFCEISPLTWNKYGCDMLKASAKWGIQPVITVETPMGDTGAVTYAGNIAQKIAELLSGLVIVQLLEEGLPVYFVVPLETFDMRTTQICLASRPDYIYACAVGQIERYLNIPFFSPVSPDSKLQDMQHAYELSFSLLPRMLSGNRGIVLHGLDQTHAISNELLLMFDEMVLSARRMIDGIEVNQETLAFEPLMEVASKMDGNRRNGHFLNHKHTLEWYNREQVPRRDNLIDKHRREKWLEMGSKTFIQRANEMADKILSSHKPEPLPKDIKNQIKKIHEKYNIPEIF